jgi:hypothetical protein
MLDNPIRYSNFPNKIIFNLSIYILIISLFRKKFTSINKIDLYYLVIILTYLFPYMVAFVYPKHCTSLYILSHLYVFLYLLKTKNLKIIKKFKVLFDKFSNYVMRPIFNFVIYFSYIFTNYS